MVSVPITSLGQMTGGSSSMSTAIYMLNGVTPGGGRVLLSTPTYAPKMEMIGTMKLSIFNETPKIKKSVRKPCSFKLNELSSNITIHRVDIVLSPAFRHNRALLAALDRAIKSEFFKDWIILKCEAAKLEIDASIDALELYSVLGYDSLKYYICHETCFPLPLGIRDGLGSALYFLVNFERSVNFKVSKIDDRLLSAGPKTKESGIQLRDDYMCTFDRFLFFVDDSLEPLLKSISINFEKLMYYNHVAWGFFQHWLRIVIDKKVGMPGKINNLHLKKATKEEMLSMRYENVGNYFIVCEVLDLFIYATIEVLEKPLKCFAVKNFENKNISATSIVQYFRQFLFLHDEMDYIQYEEVLNYCAADSVVTLTVGRIKEESEENQFGFSDWVTVTEEGESCPVVEEPYKVSSCNENSIGEINSVFGLIATGMITRQEIRDVLLPFVRQSLAKCFISFNSGDITLQKTGKSGPVQNYESNFNEAVALSRKEKSFDMFLNKVYVQLRKKLSPMAARNVMHYYIYDHLKRKYSSDFPDLKSKEKENTAEEPNPDTRNIQLESPKDNTANLESNSLKAHPCYVQLDRSEIDHYLSKMIKSSFFEEKKERSYSKETSLLRKFKTKTVSVKMTRLEDIIGFENLKLLESGGTLNKDILFQALEGKKSAEIPENTSYVNLFIKQELPEVDIDPLEESTGEFLTETKYLPYTTSADENRNIPQNLPASIADVLSVSQGNCNVNDMYFKKANTNLSEEIHATNEYEISNTNGNSQFQVFSIENVVPIITTGLLPENTPLSNILQGMLTPIGIISQSITYSESSEEIERWPERKKRKLSESCEASEFRSSKIVCSEFPEKPENTTIKNEIVASVKVESVESIKQEGDIDNSISRKTPPTAVENPRRNSIILRENENILKEATNTVDRTCDTTNFNTGTNSEDVSNVNGKSFLYTETGSKQGEDISLTQKSGLDCAQTATAMWAVLEEAENSSLKISSKSKDSSMTQSELPLGEKEEISGSSTAVHTSCGVKIKVEFESEVPKYQTIGEGIEDEMVSSDTLRKGTLPAESSVNVVNEEGSSNQTSIDLSSLCSLLRFKLNKGQENKNVTTVPVVFAKEKTTSLEEDSFQVSKPNIPETRIENSQNIQVITIDENSVEAPSVVSSCEFINENESILAHQKTESASGTLGLVERSPTLEIITTENSVESLTPVSSFEFTNENETTIADQETENVSKTLKGLVKRLPELEIIIEEQNISDKTPTVVDETDVEIQVVECNNTGNGVKCPVCQRMYSDKKTLEAHKRIAHAKIELFRCTECRKAFYKSHFLELHVKRKHEKSNFCKYCEVVLNDDLSLEIHLASLKHAQNKRSYEIGLS